MPSIATSNGAEVNSRVRRKPSRGLHSPPGKRAALKGDNRSFWRVSELPPRHNVREPRQQNSTGARRASAHRRQKLLESVEEEDSVRSDFRIFGYARQAFHHGRMIAAQRYGEEPRGPLFGEKAIGSIRQPRRLLQLKRLQRVNRLIGVVDLASAATPSAQPISCGLPSQMISVTERHSG